MFLWSRIVRLVTRAYIYTLAAWHQTAYVNYPTRQGGNASSRFGKARSGEISRELFKVLYIPRYFFITFIFLILFSNFFLL